MKRKISIFLLCAFFVRLIFSLTTEFWFPDQDVLQIYLIGLKSFTTGQFPFYGADLVYTHAQIPGALQAYLVSAMWYLIKIPEAPFILLNLLMTASSGLLAWYIARRLPQFPGKILWVWVLFTSWSVCYFTKLVNPSYVVPGAILFWIGIFEIYPQLSIGVINRKLAFFMVGFAVVWIFQLHMSWVLLIPFVMYAFYNTLKNKEFKQFFVDLGFLALGKLAIGILVIPTLLLYGMKGPGGVGVTSVIQFHFDHLLEAVDYLVKFLSYACYDTTRFIGGDSAQRMNFLRDYIWVSPAVLIVSVFGFFQVIMLVLRFFFGKNRPEKWNAVKIITLAAYIFMALSSVFSVATPGGHATVLMFPLVMIYSAYCFVHYLANRKIVIAVWVVIISSFVMYGAIAKNNFDKISLYKNRGVIVKALENNDYRLVGKRRYEQ